MQHTNITPIGSADSNAPRPSTTLTWTGESLTATDHASGQTIHFPPATTPGHPSNAAQPLDAAPGSAAGQSLGSAPGAGVLDSAARPPDVPQSPGAGAGLDAVRSAGSGTRDGVSPRVGGASGGVSPQVPARTEPDGAVRLAPSSLLHYRYDQDLPDSDSIPVTGLAVVDRDGLVLIDLPGEWAEPDVQDFATKAQLPVKDARKAPTAWVRAALAARSPGWTRLTGIPAPPPARWRKPVAICAGVAALAAMLYLVSIGAGYAWRAFSTLGRVLVDVIEAKWLAVLFSPLLLVFAPVRNRLHRRRLRRGAAIASIAGLNLDMTAYHLRINRGSQTLATIPRSRVEMLLLYRHRDLTGLFVLSPMNTPLHHLPGPWSPEHVNRFAARHDLRLELRTLSHAEYLTLVTTAKEATP